MKMKYTPRSMRTFNFDNMVKTPKKNGFFDKDTAKAVRKEGVVKVAIINLQDDGLFVFDGKDRLSQSEAIRLAKAGGYSAYKIGAQSRVTVRI